MNDWIHLRITPLPKATNSGRIPHRDSMRSFESDLHTPIHLENNVTFPRAISMERRCLPSRPRDNRQSLSIIVQVLHGLVDYDSNDTKCRKNRF